ncbi:hypothetical protein LD13_gp057 [Bacillus phage Bobb]|uniref:Uncharacterized protein n=1 Tax=Bacillus phage Bobb TaxID=1527469 RepID=A0A076G8P5_9CAUD|nr:hypothetical protein LD13_gp057 [Bacillus phage Bobb]AII27958.1 hypothetical protein [Bacillus phage Bobb]
MIGEQLKSSIAANKHKFEEAHENFVKELEEFKRNNLQPEYDRVQAILEQSVDKKNRS